MHAALIVLGILVAVALVAMFGTIQAMDKGSPATQYKLVMAYTMNLRTATRAGVVGFALGLLSCWVAYGLSHPPKSRASRYMGVNNLRTVSIVLSNAIAPGAAQ